MRRVKRGEPLAISAAEWNELADMANADASGARGQSLSTPPSQTIWLKNTLGVDLWRYQVVPLLSTEYALENPGNVNSTNSIQDQIHTTGTDRWGRLAALVEPIAVGRIGRAIVSGYALIRCVGLAGKVSSEVYTHAYLATNWNTTANYAATISTSGQIRLLRTIGPNLSHYIVPALINCNQPLWLAKLTGALSANYNVTANALLHFLDGLQAENPVTVRNSAPIARAVDDYLVVSQCDGGIFQLVSKL